jgi:hypothetical protein
MSATATGVGSLPGEDPVEAAREVFEVVPELPFLAELPARGPGADMVGRTAALLVDLHVDLQPSGWRLVGQPGIDERRARSFLARDLDAMAEQADGYRGPLKVACAGPWTMCAELSLQRRGKALIDPGAVRDVTSSLAAGVAAYRADVQERIPGAELIVQLDEPWLPAVLLGAVPTESGFGALRAVTETVAETQLTEVLIAAGSATVVHCCAPRAPVGLVRRSGAHAVSMGLPAIGSRDDDELAEAVEAGLILYAGIAPGAGAPPFDVPTVSLSLADQVRTRWSAWGFDPAQLATTSPVVVITPSCGLAGADPGYARSVLLACREAARRIVDDPQG